MLDNAEALEEINESRVLALHRCVNAGLTARAYTYAGRQIRHFRTTRLVPETLWISSRRVIQDHISAYGSRPHIHTHTAAGRQVQRPSTPRKPLCRLLFSLKSCLLSARPKPHDSLVVPLSRRTLRDNGDTDFARSRHQHARARSRTHDKLACVFWRRSCFYCSGTRRT